jgi:hypothetical protein
MPLVIELVLLLTSLITHQNVVGTARQVVEVLRGSAGSMGLVGEVVSLANTIENNQS